MTAARARDSDRDGDAAVEHSAGPGDAAEGGTAWSGIAPAPRREPDFDDEVTQRHLALMGRDARLLPFPAGLPTRAAPAGPTPRPTTSAPRSTPSRVRAERGRPNGPGGPAARATRSGELPDPARFGRQFLQGVLEVLSGRRPAGQLAMHATMGVHASLTRDLLVGDRLGIPGGKPTVYSVRVMEPADGVAELSAVIQVGPRFRAVAARLEGIDGRWRCVRLHIG